jgi:integrase
LYTFGLSPIKPEMVGELIKIPPARLQSPRDILSEDEARQLLASVTPGRDRCLIRVMLDGGLRVSEALALTAPNIYEADNRHFVHVARRKGNKARDVEIPPDLYQSLQKFNGRLFSIHRSSAWRIVVKTAESAGVGKHITPHSLRHTHGHQLRLAGWPIEPIAQRLGHASIETTKVYTRPAELAMQLNLPQMPWNFEA